MAAQAEEVVELAKKYFCHVNLTRLSFSDKMLWMLYVLRNMGRQCVYENLAQMAEDGLVVFPDGTYVSARLTDKGQRVANYMNCHMGELSKVCDTQGDGTIRYGYVNHTIGATGSIPIDTVALTQRCKDECHGDNVNFKEEIV